MTSVSSDEAAHRSADRVRGIPDAESLAGIDALVRVAASVCGAPIALAGLLDERQWAPGLTATQVATLRDLSTGVVTLLEARTSAIEHRARENESTRAAAEMTRVLDSVPAMVGYWDRDLRNRFANALYETWFGRTRATIRGCHLREVIGEQLFARNQPLAERALRGEPQRFEREFPNGTGGTGTSVTVYTPDVRDGEVQGFVVMVTDVTDLKVALAESERRNALLQLAEEVSGVGHWRADLVKKEVYWSPQVYLLHGLDPATFRPTLAGAIDTYHPDDRARVGETIERAIERQEPFDFQLRLVRADGGTRLVHAMGRCEVDPHTGATSALFGVFQDLTERETLREQLTRQERLVTTGTLAAGVGHEINNPLTYVGANLELAIDELRAIAAVSPSIDVGELLDLLGDARDGADRIRKIVRGLRAFAREDSASAPSDVHAALEVSVNMAMHELRHRATLVMELGDVPLVFADESRLAQVFVNLMVNAAQAFTGGDAKRNRIVVRTQTTADGGIAIEVADNGPGIADSVLPRIFDPFFTTKSVGQGTGLGLSISHNLVASLGGELTCTTELGRGTTFRVLLPAAPEPTPTDVAPTPSEIEPPGRVLVVDDDEGVLRSVARVLRADHDVTALHDAREAARRVVDESERFDVVFCDLMMPDVTGMELYARTLAEHPQVAERFVFLTGGALHEETRAFLAGVPNEWLEKPFDNRTLRAIARRFVDAARAGTAHPR